MKLSIVIPTYNQSEKTLKNLQESILPFFDKTGIAYSVLIEADHSSEEEVKKLQEGLGHLPMQVKLDEVEDKKGKGWAIKKGILHSEGDYVLFMDADLATDLSCFSLFQKDLGKYDAYVASRDAKGSVYVRKQPFVRRLTHWGAKTIIRNKFRIKGVHDTQCGFKMFQLPLAKEMAKHQLTSGNAFDVEDLYFLSLNGAKIQEYPAKWRDDPDSTAGNVMKTSLAFYKELNFIKKHKKTYLLSKEEKEGLGLC